MDESVESFPLTGSTSIHCTEVFLALFNQYLNNKSDLVTLAVCNTNSRKYLRQKIFVIFDSPVSTALGKGRAGGSHSRKLGHLL